jgi:hypothetical protein
MTSLKTVLGFAAATGVAVGAIAIPAPARDHDSAVPQAAGLLAPVASSSGSDMGPPVYPSLVNVRLVRAQALLQDAASAQDKGDAAGAVKALDAARSDLAKAWVGAKYLIDNAPPPAPAGDDAYARTSGAAPGGASPYADQYVTTAAVLSLQHAVAVTAMGMLDLASEPLLTSVSKSIFAALNARDVAIAYMKQKDPPPVAGDGRVHAGASGAPIAAGWSSIGQAVLPDLDDEQQMIDGIRASVKLSPGRARVLDAVEIQDIRTGKKINQNWPPGPVGD